MLRLQNIRPPSKHIGRQAGVELRERMPVVVLCLRQQAIGNGGANKKRERIPILCDLSSESSDIDPGGFDQGLCLAYVKHGGSAQLVATLRQIVGRASVLQGMACQLQALLVRAKLEISIRHLGHERNLYGFA